MIHNLPSFPQQYLYINTVKLLKICHHARMLVGSLIMVLTRTVIYVCAYTSFFALTLCK